MKFKKVILVMTDNHDQSIVSNVIQFCRKFRSKLFVLFVIETDDIPTVTHLNREIPDDLQEEIEEQGWQVLYLAEDEAVEKGVWTSLHMENGDAVTIMKKYVDVYDIDTVFVTKRDDNKKLFVSSPVMVIGL